MPADSPTIHHTEHHGIPVVWADLEGPLTGTLMFGVGMRDEPAHLAGITHLTEHLLFRSLGSDIVPFHDGRTSGSRVEFYVTGTEMEVATFLNDLVEVVGTTPFNDADLLLERRVIEAESPAAFSPNAGLLTFRYGVGSIGNAHAGSPTLASISLDEVREWVRTWMVTSNAHLVFTGPPPDALDLRLPDGPRPEHRLDRSFLTSPTLVECEKSGVALSMLVAEHMSSFLRDALECELSADLRHRHGLIYSTDTEITAIDDDVDQVDFVLDPLDDDNLVVIERAVATLRLLAQEGVSETAVAVARSACLQAMTHPDVWRAELDGLAITALVGGNQRSVAKHIEQARGLTSEALTTALRDALDTLVVAFDEDLEIPENFAEKHQLELDLFVTWETKEDLPTSGGSSWRGRRDLSFRDRAIIDGDVLWTRLFGVVCRVEFRDIAVVGEHADGALSVIDVRGRYLLIDPRDWWRGESLRQEVLSRVPDHVRRDFSWHGEDRPPRPSVETSETESFRPVPVR